MTLVLADSFKICHVTRVATDAVDSEYPSPNR
jgi:hypothetical protein